VGQEQRPFCASVRNLLFPLFFLICKPFLTFLIDNYYTGKILFFYQRGKNVIEFIATCTPDWSICCTLRQQLVIIDLVFVGQRAESGPVVHVASLTGLSYSLLWMCVIPIHSRTTCNTRAVVFSKKYQSCIGSIPFPPARSPPSHHADRHGDVTAVCACSSVAAAVDGYL
jgi:hypothetical protein